MYICVFTCTNKKFGVVVLVCLLRVFVSGSRINSKLLKIGQNVFSGTHPIRISKHGPEGDRQRVVVLGRGRKRRISTHPSIGRMDD